MGEGLGHALIAYLDTHIVMWLGQGNGKRISAEAKRILDRADLLISPMVLLELEYLYELKRLKLPSQEVWSKIQHETKVRLCDISFLTVVNWAVGEKWTRDPFDRVIVAQAKANGLAALVSADEAIGKHYPRTVW